MAAAPQQRPRARCLSMVPSHMQHTSKVFARVLSKARLILVLSKEAFPPPKSGFHLTILAAVSFSIHTPAENTIAQNFKIAHSRRLSAAWVNLFEISRRLGRTCSNSKLPVGTREVIERALWETRERVFQS